MSNEVASSGAPEVSRRTALALLGSAAVLPALAPMFDASAAPLTYDMKPEPIARGVWVLRGAQEAIERSNGGAIANITIIDTSDGAVIVDSGPSKRYGVALEALARQLTGKTVARVYLTHFHPDHVFGNQAFDAAIVAAPRGVIDGLADLGEAFASAMYHAAGDWMRGTEVVMPGKVVGDGVEEIGGRRFRLATLAGHTASDLVIFEENSGLLVAGDLAFLDRAPTTPHADLDKWRTSLDTLASMSSALLVPGHGPIEPGKRAVTQTRDWLSVMEDAIRGAFDRGLSMNEAMVQPLPQWTEKVALARYEFDRSVMHFFPKLEAGEWPRVDRPG
ncbi:MAG: quinoprotein relay system zinc metallohydrolase 1 [Hyphomicrobiaceae bacterium]